ncbi:MAG: IS110 family transposase [Armatimonadetes bacterium]|nr:IS110 family transposase [Armatimonadota bacterium]
MQYTAFDVHKHYTWARVERPDGTLVREKKIPHEPGALRQFLARCEPGSPVAVETVGNWYWIVDEVEAAGCVPQLVHAHKAKLMVGRVNKTDRLDARGLVQLQRAGTLPMVWIPPRELRDVRELPRARMVLVHQRTRLKNRIHATLSKYAIQFPEVADLFGKRGRQKLQARLSELPPHTGFVVSRLLALVESLDREIAALEQRMGELFEVDDATRLLMTIPGVGFILATVMSTEIGDVTRFPRNEQLAAYAGTVPRVHESGGHRHYGPVQTDVNQYLKWAFVEAATVTCRHRRTHPQRHTTRLYERIAHRRGHEKAIVAVARHLAEAAYWMLTKGEPYRDPGSSRGT